MDKKIIFFDIDGTLVYSEQGVEKIREKTKEAIQKTRAKGNLVYLCTGRSKAEIYDFIWDIGVDGFIGAGGGYVEIDKEVLYHHCFTPKNVEKVLQYFNTYHYDFYMESNGGLYGSANLVPRLESIIYGDVEHDEAAKKRKANGNAFIQAIKTNQCMQRSDITKMCFLEHPTIPFNKIKEEFENDFTIHHCTVKEFGEDSGELSIKGVHKAKAIHDVLEKLNIPKSNTFAFGDGLNDIEMLEYCHIGIAMGNAKEGLKKVADEICKPSHQDGIYEMMEKHNLI